MRDTAIEMAKRLLVDSIWKSANLEGLGTTFPKTEAILANAPTNTKTEEVLFVINMKRAWQFLLDNLEYNNSIMLLREYNKIVGELLFHYAGEIRLIPVQIGGTSWEPEIQQTGIIIDTLEDIEKIEDIEKRALKYFCYVARTQMFIDGNKRVAQLMANKVLVEHDIGIFQSRNVYSGLWTSRKTQEISLTPGIPGISTLPIRASVKGVKLKSIPL